MKKGLEFYRLKDYFGISEAAYLICGENPDEYLNAYDRLGCELSPPIGYYAIQGKILSFLGTGKGHSRISRQELERFIKECPVNSAFSFSDELEDDKDAKISILQAENDALKAKVAELEAKEKVEKKMDPREKNTLLRVIGGLFRSMKIDLDRNATSKILNKLEAQDVILSDDKIRGIVNEIKSITEENAFPEKPN